MKQAARLAKSSGNQQIALSLKEFAQMMSENVQVLNNHPEYTVQEAANFPDSSAPAKAAQVLNHVTESEQSIRVIDKRGVCLSVLFALERWPPSMSPP